MVGIVLTCAALAAASGGVIGYAVGCHSRDEDDLHRADAIEGARALAYKEGFAAGTWDAERRCDELYGTDWDNGYNAGLEVGRSGSPDPVTLTTTATAVREARLKWIRAQMSDHLTTYKDAFWRVLELARDVGERYRKVEALGQAGLIPIGDALNVCVYVADIAKQYQENKVFAQPHGGLWEGKPS